MLIAWHDDSVENSPFTIEPKQKDIRPKSLVEFEIAFRPEYEDEYYFRHIAATAYFKVGS